MVLSSLLTENPNANLRGIIVQQQRDPKTFEPLGCYQVSFSTADAAGSYHENLIRLQRLARHRLSSTSGLWESTAPVHLKPSSGTVEEDLARLTVASPSSEILPITRTRTSLRYPWAAALTKLVGQLGFGSQPPVVLVKAYPLGLPADKLAHFIEQDGWVRDLQWSVSKPLMLEEKARNEEEPAPNSPSRFILACETDWEARRFHRKWNKRTVSYRLEDEETEVRFVLTTSVIDW